METLTLPKGGKTMEEGMILEWMFEEGEAVSAGDPVVLFESDKMTSEVVAESDGVLLERAVPEGETVPVGTVLGYVGARDESVADTSTATEPTGDGAKTDVSSTDRSIEAPESGGDAPRIDERRVHATPSARSAVRQRGTSVLAVAAETGVKHVTAALVEEYADASRDVGSGSDAPTVRPLSDEGITVEPVSNPEGGAVLASPWARAVASNIGVAVEDVAAYADTDRVRAADVDHYVNSLPDQESTVTGGSAPGAQSAAHGVSASDAGDTPGTKTSISAGEPPAIARDETLTGAAGVMFDRMSEVNDRYASTTTVAKVDVTSLVELYERLSDAWSDEDSLSLTAFVVGAVGRTLPAYETLNAEVTGARELRVYDDVNVGIAVNTDAGLFVPTVYHADSRTLRELSSDIGRLATRARNSDLDHDDLQNGTFTVSNAGNLGAYINTPQINPPQSAILGICSIVDEPGIVDGEVIPRKFMHLTLTYDHRIIEGAEAVGFLQEVKSLLEQPESLLS